MAFIFCLLDTILTLVLSIDTLALLYQIRKESKCEQKDFLGVCFAWVLFMILKSIFCCSGKGLLCTVFGIIGFVLKAYVVLPRFGTPYKVYYKLVEEKKAEEFIKKGYDFVQSKFNKAAAPPAQQTS